MKTAILLVTVIGMPLLLSTGLASADDIHCWLHHARQGRSVLGIGGGSGSARDIALAGAPGITRPEDLGHCRARRHLSAPSRMPMASCLLERSYRGRVTPETPSHSGCASTL